MFRRFLRLLFFLPLLACLVLWPTSYFREPFLSRLSSTRAHALWFVRGGFYLGEIITGGLDPCWRSGLDSDVSETPVNVPDIGHPHFLGFSFGTSLYFSSAPIHYLRVPLWFATTLSLALFLLIWRITRRRMSDNAFPIQPASAPT